MQIVRSLTSLKIKALPSQVLEAAQRGFDTVVRDLRDWISFVDFLVRPVDVHLALENGDLDLRHNKRSFKKQAF